MASELARTGGNALAITADSVLALVGGGRDTLQRAITVGDPAAVADVQKRAEAIRYLSQKAKLSIEAVNAAAQLKTDAEWHAGRMLRETEKNPGGRPTENLPQVEVGFAPTPAELGISSIRFQSPAAEAVAGR